MPEQYQRALRTGLEHSLGEAQTELGEAQASEPTSPGLISHDGFVGYAIYTSGGGVVMGRADTTNAWSFFAPFATDAPEVWEYSLLTDEDAQNLRTCVSNDVDPHDTKHRIAQRIIDGETTLYSTIDSSLLSDSNEPLNVRRTALEILTGLRQKEYDDKAAACISAALDDEDTQLRVAAIHCLLNINYDIQVDFLPKIKNLCRSREKSLAKAAKAFVSFHKTVRKNK